MGQGSRVAGRVPLEGFGRHRGADCSTFVILPRRNPVDSDSSVIGRGTTDHGELAEWVGREILPHERELRSWLLRRAGNADDAEDIVQECYCRLAQLRDVTHITQPRAYLFTVARNLLQQQLKSARVVRIDAMVDTGVDWESDDPSPERLVFARQELARVQAAMATLTDRARRIFIMRRVDGMAQKEIARVLDVSEAVVENDASRSLRAILRLLTDPEEERSTGPTERRRVRAR